MSPLSSEEVARMLGIGPRTLESWISEGRVKPKTMAIGKKVYRVWTEHEVAKVRKVKERTYRKGRGRKKKGP